MSAIVGQLRTTGKRPLPPGGILLLAAEAVRSNPWNAVEWRQTRRHSAGATCLTTNVCPPTNHPASPPAPASAGPPSPGKHHWNSCAPAARRRSRDGLTATSSETPISSATPGGTRRGQHDSRSTYTQSALARATSSPSDCRPISYSRWARTRRQPEIHVVTSTTSPDTAGRKYSTLICRRTSEPRTTLGRSRHPPTPPRPSARSSCAIALVDGVVEMSEHVAFGGSP
ncbi:MAG: hypothetical protein MAG451_01390 [Anaerolineales bacterium]|nr:hypothetical protein [Anaerolineales bacterium]